MLQDRRILLIISGGIAAYKSLDLIRRLREDLGFKPKFPRLSDALAAGTM